MSLVEFLLMLGFAFVSLLTIFSLKSKLSLAIAAFVIQLFIIQFLNLSIQSPDLLRELILAFSLYFALFLPLLLKEDVSRETFIKNFSESRFVEKDLRCFENSEVPFIQKNGKQENHFFKINSVNSILAILILSYSIAATLIVLEIPKIRDKVMISKSLQIKESSINPMILPSHPAHLAVKKFYLSKGDKSPKKFENNKKKMEEQKKLGEARDSLAKTIFFKRSSEIFLVCIFLILFLGKLTKLKQIDEIQ